MTHTPGKWTAECDHIVARNDAGLVNNANNSIARLYGPDVDANAALIAAAPELLEACKGLLRQLKHCESLLDPSEFDSGQGSRAEDTARAAIAKAKERTQ